MGRYQPSADTEQVGAGWGGEGRKTKDKYWKEKPTESLSGSPKAAECLSVLEYGFGISTSSSFYPVLFFQCLIVLVLVPE